MAVAWPIDREELDELFRFALFLGGDREEAARVTRDVLHSLEARPEASEEDRARRYCFLEIRKRQLKSHPQRSGALLKPPGAPAGNLPDDKIMLETLRGFPEPVRSAAALFYGTSLATEDIGRVLDLSPKELAVEIGLVRSNLLALSVPTP